MGNLTRENLFLSGSGTNRKDTFFPGLAGIDLCHKLGEVQVGNIESAKRKKREGQRIGQRLYESTGIRQILRMGGQGVALC